MPTPGRWTVWAGERCANPAQILWAAGSNGEAKEGRAGERDPLESCQGNSIRTRTHSITDRNNLVCIIIQRRQVSALGSLSLIYIFPAITKCQTWKLREWMNKTSHLINSTYPFWNIKMSSILFQSRSRQEDPEQLRLKQKAKEVSIC